MTTEEMTKYMFLEDENPKGDLGFIFGTWFAWERSIEKAAELYHKNLIPKFIVTGGENRRNSIIEGDLMAQELEKKGVPKENILIESKSTNTLENVTLSLPIIDKEIGLENINVITAIVKNYHARRALMTLKKHFPPHITFKAAVYIADNYPFTKDDWFETEKGQEKVTTEYEKIQKYLKKGDIAELAI
jgi:uncharacterized SAM-binding protein YcdF (DUF218 family)